MQRKLFNTAVIRVIEMKSIKFQQFASREIPACKSSDKPRSYSCHLHAFTKARH